MTLKKNVGRKDRSIRLAVAGLLVVLGIATGQIILSALALVVLITSLSGYCPLYYPLKIDTTKEDAD